MIVIHRIVHTVTVIGFIELLTATVSGFIESLTATVIGYIELLMLGMVYLLTGICRITYCYCDKVY